MLELLGTQISLLYFTLQRRWLFSKVEDSIELDRFLLDRQVELGILWRLSTD